MKYDSSNYLEDKSIEWLQNHLVECQEKELQEEIAVILIEKVEKDSINIPLSTIITAFDCCSMQEVLEKSEKSPNTFISLGAHLNMVNRMSNTRHAELFENNEASKGNKKIKQKVKKERKYIYGKY